MYIHVHIYIHTLIREARFWSTALVVVPICKLRPCTSKHSLLKPHAISNCIYLFISSHLDIYLAEFSFFVFFTYLKFLFKYCVV